MAHPDGINLISTTVERNPELENVTMILRRLSYGGLILLIASGAIVGGLFGYLTIQRDALTGDKKDLSATIAQESTKEGLLLAVKERAAVVKKVAGSQKQISPLFVLVGQLSPPGPIQTISYDDNGTALVITSLSSIGDAATLVNSLLTLVESHRAEKPKLVSLSLSKQGTIELSVSFVPVL